MDKRDTSYQDCYPFSRRFLYKSKVSLIAAKQKCAGLCSNYSFQPIAFETPSTLEDTHAVDFYLVRAGLQAQTKLRAGACNELQVYFSLV